MDRDGWSEVAPGFFRLTKAHVNCYLVRTADGITLVDAGLPRTDRVLGALLRHLGARAADIDALVLTHGHFDHVGMARRLRDLGTPVHAHPRDLYLARHPYSYRPASPRLGYVLAHPRGIPLITRMALNGAIAVRGVTAEGTLADRHSVDVPGAPIALWTPGHTEGHCALLFQEAGVLLTGDALVALDPYTGEGGPQIVARAATADPEQAMSALRVLADTGARLVLPGHGAACEDGAKAAVEEAVRRGPH